MAKKRKTKARRLGAVKKQGCKVFRTASGVKMRGCYNAKGQFRIKGRA
jgi:hypothetical protein